MEINLNDMVRVKLTDHGRAVYAADHATFWASAGRSMPYSPPKEDADGWSKWQLWSLMQAFGPHIGMGLNNCFDVTIQLVEKKPVQKQPTDVMQVVRGMCK